MITSFGLSNATVAVIVIVALPALIIAVGELEERLRQRDSAYRSAVATLRVWVLPLLAIWVLGRTLFDASVDNLLIRFLDTALLLAAATTVLSALRVFVAGLIDRPRRTGRRAVPRLLLAVPRLIVILLTAWTLIAGIWGVDLSSALQALGVTTLVISFALQDTLGGIASGFTLLADQPFSAGDWIQSEDVEGKVIDVNWRSTRIEDRDGNLVVIPNGQLSKATIVNLDQPSRVQRVMVPVQIERTAPPTAAKAMLVDAARSTPGVLDDPAPMVFVTNIADPVVDYQAYMWIDDASIAPRVRADFASLVWYLSYRHDVPLPNPAQDLYLFDGAKAAIESQVSSADVRRALLDAPLFAEVPDEVVDGLAANSTLVEYQEGETIVASGRQNDLFVLDHGRAEFVLRGASGADLHVLDVGRGDIFGLVSEVAATDHVGVVVALSDCRVVRIPADAAAAAVSGASGLGEALDQLGVSRRRRCDRVLRRAAREAGPAAGSGDPTIDRATTAEPES